MKKKLKTCCLLCFISLGTLSVSAFEGRVENLTPSQISQEKKKITGTVLDEFGEPLIGASVVKPGTSTGAIVDIDGNFSLDVNVGDKLEVSFIGYLPILFEVDSKNNYELTLSQDLKSLEEIVVIGYGTQRKGSVTGSVTGISSKDIVKSPVSNTANALAGRLPGLRVMNTSGDPGADLTKIDVRGFGNALVIVDGVPSNFNQIDPNEIENISVLKDASAAVYGVKAANGVILITTKRGVTGETKINFNSTFSWQRPTIYPKGVNAAQYVEMVDEDKMNRGETPIYGAEEVAKWRAGGEGYGSTNWYEEMIRNYSPQQQYNLNVSGGTDKLKYFSSLGFLNQEGLYKSGSSHFERYNIRSNVDAKITKALTSRISISGRKEKVTRPYSSSDHDSAYMHAMMSTVRNYPTFDGYAPGSNGEYLGKTNVDAHNPRALSDKDIVGYHRRIRKVFEGSIDLNYDFAEFVKGLNANAMFHYKNRDTDTRRFRKEYQLYGYNADKDVFESVYTGNKPSKLTRTSDVQEDKVFQGSLNYSNLFKGVHDVSALFLFETRQGYNDWFDGEREYIIDALDELNSGSKTNIGSGGTSFKEGNIGYVGRLNYAYDSRYLAEFSFRYDGSSNFPSGDRWGFFPSVSVGWRLGQEAFIKNKTKIIDDIKIRASWGRLGDDEFPADVHRFQYATGYVYPQGNYMLGESVIPTLRTRGLANPLLTWYTSDLYNVGVDAVLFKGKLSAEFDVFYRKRKDLLSTRAAGVSSVAGTSMPLENLNKDSHRGFELSLTHRNALPNGIQYSINGNVAYTREKKDFNEQSMAINSWDHWRWQLSDRWANMTWGYEATGQFQSYEEIASSPVQDGNGNKTLRPGDIKYLDNNNDGVINDNDHVVIGRSTKPELNFGLNLSASWKDIDVAVFLQGAANYSFYHDAEMQVPFFNGASSLEDFYDRWHRKDAYDPNSEWIAGKFPSTYVNGLDNNKKYSSFWFKKADYLRIKDIQVGYSIPKKYLNTVGIERLRVFFSGYNLFTFTGLDLMDPEAESGVRGYYPQQKILSFGFNLTL